MNEAGGRMRRVDTESRGRGPALGQARPQTSRWGRVLMLYPSDGRQRREPDGLAVVLGLIILLLAVAHLVAFVLSWT